VVKKVTRSTTVSSGMLINSQVPLDESITDLKSAQSSYKEKERARLSHPFITEKKEIKSQEASAA